MARWGFRNMFSIFPILGDFLAMKLFKIPIFLWKHKLIFASEARFARTNTKMRHFVLIFKLCDIISWLRRKSLQESTRKLCAIFKMEIPSVFVALMIRSHERFSHNRVSQRERASIRHEWRKLTAKEVFFNHRLHLHYCCC